MDDGLLPSPVEVERELRLDLTAQAYGMVNAAGLPEKHIDLIQTHVAQYIEQVVSPRLALAFPSKELRRLNEVDPSGSNLGVEYPFVEAVLMIELGAALAREAAALPDRSDSQAP